MASLENIVVQATVTQVRLRVAEYEDYKLPAL